MNSTNLFIGLTIILLGLSCDREYDFSDVYEGTKVEVKDQSSLYADSVSYSLVEITTGGKWRIERDQAIRVSTSHGKLLVQPYDFSVGGSKEVVLRPFDDMVQVVLVARTLDTVDQVFVSVNIDSFFVSTETSFQAALPSDMQFVPMNQFVTEDETELVITAELYRKHGATSNGLRFQPTVVIESSDTSQQESLRWSVPDYIFSSNKKVTLPFRVIRHVPGTVLRVSLSTNQSERGVLEKSILLYFQ